MSIDRRLNLRVVSTRRIATPDTPMTQGGIMALTIVPGTNRAYVRGVPASSEIEGNMILGARLVDRDGQLQLEDMEPVLSKEMFPVSLEGARVIAYEDGTANRNGLYASQVCEGRTDGRPYVNLVHLNTSTRELRTVASPLDPKVQALNSDKSMAITMVKEAEEMVVNRQKHLLFEYYAQPLFTPEQTAKEKLQLDIIKSVSRISIWKLNEDGELTDGRPFHTSKKMGRSMFSTAGKPLKLADGRTLLFFNRSKDGIWGVTHMVLDGLKKQYVHLEFDITVPEDQEVQPVPSAVMEWGTTQTSFGSDIRQVDEHTVCIVYHLNESAVIEALVEIDVPLLSAEV